MLAGPHTVFKALIYNITHISSDDKEWSVSISITSGGKHEGNSHGVLYEQSKHVEYNIASTQLHLHTHIVITLVPVYNDVWLGIDEEKQSNHTCMCVAASMRYAHL